MAAGTSLAHPIGIRHAERRQDTHLEGLHDGGILLSDWHPVGGGEAGHVVADPSDPDTVWAGEYLGYISRWDGRTGQAPHLGIDPDNGSGRKPVELRHRFQWTAPIAVSLMPYSSR